MAQRPRPRPGHAELSGASFLLSTSPPLFSLSPADPAAALRDYAAVVRSEPNHLPAALGVATALDALGKTDAAITAYSAVLRADPAHVRALFARGSLYNRVGDFERANCDLERALELDGKREEEGGANGGGAAAKKAGSKGGLPVAARAGAATASASPPPYARQPPLRPRSVSPIVVAKATFSEAAAALA